MQQEIKYGTFSAAPDDYLAPDGNLAAMAGLERKDGALWGELPRATMIEEIPNGYTILCIHKVTDKVNGKEYKFNYICWQPANSTLYKLYQDGTVPYDGGRICSFDEGVTIQKVEPIGNMLVVLASDGVHYVLWKEGYYRYLGTHLPELDLRFELSDEQEYESDEHTVDWDITGHPDVFDTLTPISWFDSDTVWDGGESGQEVLARLRQGIMASLNEVTADVCNDKRLAFPFFVRYGYRMYDGDITMHSAPVLMVPTLNPPVLDMGWAGVSEGGDKVKNPAKIKATLNGYKLHCRPLDMDQVEELSMWSDIISSVDIFISPQFYTYNQGAKDREIVIDDALVVPPLNAKLNSQIYDNGNFFLLKQIRLSADMPQHDALLKQGGGDVKFDNETNNDNIVVRERMGDDYGTHDELFAEKSFAFNGRINLAGVSKKIFNGFNPACMWHRIGDTSHNTTTATVVIETDGREITVESAEGDVYFTNSTNKVLWFYYPNAGAKRAYLTLGGQNIELELIPHATLNGAYYCSLDEDAVQQTVQYIPTSSSDEQRLVEQPNKVYTSEVNNPFYFPVSGINTVGTGEILGICSAVRALSQGQFGQFPLYAFTTEGVWALQTNSEGGYSAVQPVTRDVCIDADSITQMDDAVLFVTARGIMVISGSTSQCISEVIDGRVGFSLGMMTEKANALKLLAGDPAVTLEMATFERFREGMRMLYDYRHQRIVVYNDTMEGGKKKYPYAYVYALREQQWNIAENDLVYNINSYPDAYAVTIDNRVVNMSEDTEPQGGIPFVMVTRPMDLGAADIHKTVTAVIQRGVFDKNHIQQVLFGSRDLLHWHLVSSSQNSLLRGYRGTPYKWFRLMVLGALDKGESIAGMTVQYDTRLTNKPR